MNLSGFSAKKIVAKRLGIPVESFVLLRLCGWLENVDSPAFLNGVANTPNAVEYDAAFPQTGTKYQATVAMKIGNTVGQEIFIDIDHRDIEEMVNVGSAGEFDLDA